VPRGEGAPPRRTAGSVCRLPVRARLNRGAAPSILASVGPFDRIAVVESAYAYAAGTCELDAIGAAAAPGMDQGFGIGVVLIALEDAGVTVRAQWGNHDPMLDAIMPAMHDAMPPEFFARGFLGAACVASMSEQPALLAETRDVAVDAASRLGFDAGVLRQLSDAVFAQVGDGLGHGVTIGAYARRPVSLRAGERRTWLRIMSHVGAALRLRARLASRSPAPPDAVLDSSGRVHHAEAGAGDRTSRIKLTDAVRAIERARGGLRRRSPEEALAAWTALVDGTWSVVDWLDSDGRRYLVAHHNRLQLRDVRRLSSREREVAEHLTQGHANADIAYALGIAEGNVSRLVTSVLRKLGAPSRRDLALLFGCRNSVALEQEDELQILRPADRGTALWSKLSPGLREVVSMAVSGMSNAEIASARSTSVRTVANQLARCYAELGVSGRAELGALLGPPPRVDV
jgi:DNA-binding NarL/FixJ family response regulator